MKRIFLFLLVSAFCGAFPVFADDNVRAAQAQLKKDGFYFGEETGVYDSETSAAVSRYQIRHGLRISGQLDGETAKALGVPSPSSEAAAQATPDATAWRRLRKADERFLKNLSTEKNGTPPSSEAPSPAAGYETLVLSRERLRDYVGAFVLAGLSPTVDAELEFFADRVKYYKEGMVNREKLRRDLRRYNQRWPERRFWLAGEIKVEPLPDSLVRVTFPLRYELQNAGKRKSGQVQKSLLLEVAGDDLQIVGVDERS